MGLKYEPSSDADPPRTQLRATVPYEETLAITGGAFQLSGVRLARNAAENAQITPPPSGGCAPPEGAAPSSPSSSCLQHVVTLPSVFPGLPAALDVQLLVCIPKTCIPEP